MTNNITWTEHFYATFEISAPFYLWLIFIKIDLEPSKIVLILWNILIWILFLIELKEFQSISKINKLIHYSVATRATCTMHSILLIRKSYKFGSKKFWKFRIDDKNCSMIMYFFKLKSRIFAFIFLFNNLSMISYTQKFYYKKFWVHRRGTSFSHFWDLIS